MFQNHVVGAVLALKKRKAGREPVFLRSKMAYYPICFASAKQYNEWLDAARMAISQHGNSGVCTDCTPEYQKQMIRERRCAYPATTFDVDPDGFVRGYRPHAKHDWRGKETA